MPNATLRVDVSYPTCPTCGVCCATVLSGGPIPVLIPAHQLAADGTDIAPECCRAYREFLQSVQDLRAHDTVVPVRSHEHAEELFGKGSQVVSMMSSMGLR